MSDFDHISNCMMAALRTAEQINIAMCLFDQKHAAQANLSAAMQSALIIAEECRQAKNEARSA